jgi:V/A-type H+-transporting ATPase subunit I
MRLTRLKLLNISAPNEYLDEVLEKVIELDEFYPEPAQNLVNSIHGAKTLREENPYEDMLKKVLETGRQMKLTPDDIETISQVEVEKIRRFMEKTRTQFEEITQIKKEIELLKEEDSSLIEQVKHIDDLGIKMKDLFASHYITSRIGRLPIDSEEKLKFFENQPFIWKTFHKDDTYSWGICITGKAHRKEIDNIFSSLFFERIFIPGFIEGTPEEAIKTLNIEINKFQKDLETLDRKEQNPVLKVSKHFNGYVALLMHLQRKFDARKYVLDFGKTFSVSGFIRDYQVNHVIELFKDIKTVEVDVRPPNGDRRLTPPKKLNHAWSARPWGVFIERGKRIGYYKT